MLNTAFLKMFNIGQLLVRKDYFRKWVCSLAWLIPLEMIKISWQYEWSIDQLLSFGRSFDNRFGTDIVLFYFHGRI